MRIYHTTKQKDDTKKIFDTFSEHCKQIYLVGGAVRDLLLGEEPDDLDFATDALPVEMEEWFEKTVMVGARYGTVAAILGRDSYEITTFRTEGGYSDSRHPDDLQFTGDMATDASRRDFTVNAFYMDQNGAIFDRHGGLADLKKGIVRCIGSPSKRFEEDPLRKWRCIRFAAEKRFEIEAQTRRAIDFDPNTDAISIERINAEFTRILMTEKVNWGGYLLVRSGLLPSLINRILPQTPAFSELELIETFELMYLLPKKLPLRLAALTRIMDEETRHTFLTELRFPTRIIAETESYCRCDGITIENGVPAFKQAAAQIGKTNLLDFAALQEGIARFSGNHDKIHKAEETTKLAQDIVFRDEPLVRKDLQINGSVLLLMGYERTDIAEALAYLLDCVYMDPSLNNRHDLKRLLRDRGKIND